MPFANDPTLKYSQCEIDPFWNERAEARISAEAEQMLLEATFQIHGMTLEAVDKIVNDDKLLQLFNINKNLWPIIKRSWESNQPDFQSRIGLSWDGKNKPKLIKILGDTANQ